MVAQSSSQSMAETSKQNCVVSNCLISLPFSFSTPPFFKQLPKSNLQLAQTSSNAFLHFHNSLLSTAEKCFTVLHSFLASQPLFNKIIKFSSHFSQVQCRTYQNLGNLSHHNFAAVLPGDSVAGIVVANGIINFLNIYNSLLVVRLVLTWFPNAPPAIVSPLRTFLFYVIFNHLAKLVSVSTLCDPYLNIFRGIIPPLGGTLDLSPILAFLVLNAFTSTASALPAELPSTTVRGSSDTPHSAPLFHLTTSQKKWMRRLSGNK